MHSLSTLLAITSICFGSALPTPAETTNSTTAFREGSKVLIVHNTNGMTGQDYMLCAGYDIAPKHRPNGEATVCSCGSRLCTSSDGADWLWKLRECEANPFDSSRSEYSFCKFESVREPGRCLAQIPKDHSLGRYALTLNCGDKTVHKFAYGHDARYPTGIFDKDSQMWMNVNKNGGTGQSVWPYYPWGSGSVNWRVILIEAGGGRTPAIGWIRIANAYGTITASFTNSLTDTTGKTVTKTRSQTTEISEEIGGGCLFENDKITIKHSWTNSLATAISQTEQRGESQTVQVQCPQHPNGSAYNIKAWHSQVSFPSHGILFNSGVYTCTYSDPNGEVPAPVPQCPPGQCRNDLFLNCQKPCVSSANIDWGQQ